MEKPTISRQTNQSLSIPTATYRVQFSRPMTFERAREIIPYLDQLGISHFYSSPFFKAGSESPHGYDISDHNDLNPAIGSHEQFNAFTDALRDRGMGHIVDFVPNHMGNDPRVNPWWRDVLENGPSSPFARYFDIDWQPVKEELENKVLIPILDDQYGRVLERGGLRLVLTEGAFTIQYYEHRFPVSPCSYDIVLNHALLSELERDDPEAFEELRSIVRAIENLPRRNELDPELCEDRIREGGVIKRRLDTLYTDNASARIAIEQAVDRFQGSRESPDGFDALHELLEAQAYRLSYWRVAAEEINYRRFFDINDLAAIRVELPEVFDHTHRLVLAMVAEGRVTGLRIDHPDGLRDPKAYLDTLQNAAAQQMGISEENANLPLYVVVEKILTGQERLPADWKASGTTGYEFARDVTGLLVDGSSERDLTDTYATFIDRRIRFHDLVYERKRLVIRLSLASEINVLGHALNRLSERNRWYRDFTLNALTAAVGEVIACFPVYRTYQAPNRQIQPEDDRAILRAIGAAKRRNPAVEGSLFDFLRDNLLFRFPSNIDEATMAEHFAFVMQFQQSTGPVMAKGLEDTAFYIYNRLVALNEVGGEPERFGLTVEEFHKRTLARLQNWPHSMVTTSTHDTKRSEDVRARIAAISEMPHRWRMSVFRWRDWNAQWKTEIDGEIAPDENEEYLLYQTLLGTWPLQPLQPQSPEREALLKRIQEYMTKAIKEAKVNSSWVQPNEEWDEAVHRFIAAILDPTKSDEFLRDFASICDETSKLGAINALTQVALKLTVPGVPDIYQGCELWDYSLVDPDNRRPVDFAARAEILEHLDAANPLDLLDNWKDGRVKMWVTTRLLRFRRKFPDLFAAGTYEPLTADGPFEKNIVAFIRRSGSSWILVVTPRLSGEIGFPPVGDRWKETVLMLPDDPDHRAGRNVLTGEVLLIEANQAVQVADLMRTFPLGVWTNVDPSSFGHQ